MLDKKTYRDKAAAVDNLPPTRKQLQKDITDLLAHAETTLKAKDDELRAKHRELWSLQTTGYATGERLLWYENPGLFSSGTTGARTDGVLHKLRDTIGTFGTSNWSAISPTVYRGAPTWDSGVTESRDGALEADYKTTDPIIAMSNAIRNAGMEFHPVFQVFRKRDDGIGVYATAGSKFYSAYKTGFVDQFLLVFNEFIDRYLPYIDGITLDYTRHDSFGVNEYLPTSAAEYATFASTWTFDASKWAMLSSGNMDSSTIATVDLEHDRARQHDPAAFSENKIRWLDFQAVEVDRVIQGISVAVRARDANMPIRPYDSLLMDVGPGQWPTSIWKGRNSRHWYKKGWITGVFMPMYRVLWGPDSTADYMVKIVAAKQSWLDYGNPGSAFHPLMANYQDSPLGALSTAELDTVLTHHDTVNTAGFDAVYIASLQTEALDAHLKASRYSSKVRSPWSQI